MWLRDTLEELCRQKLRDITDFEWQKYIRPYLIEREGEEGESSPAFIVLQCLDRRLNYGFEYQGCTSLPVMTPRMDNYILAFTQVPYRIPSVDTSQTLYYQASLHFSLEIYFIDIAYHTSAHWCGMILKFEHPRSIVVLTLLI